MNLRQIGCVAAVVWIVMVCVPRYAAAQEYQREIDRLAEEVAAAAERANLKNIAVMDFTDLRYNVQEIGRFISEELTTSLVLKERSFKTIDRANLQSILVEQRLTMSGLVNLDNVKKLKISGVEGLVMGTLTPLADEIRITIKIVKIETAEYVGATRGVVPKTSAIESLGEEIEGAAASNPSGFSTQQMTNQRQSKYVRQDKSLRVTIKYFRKDSADQIRAILLIENVSDGELKICISNLDIVDDRGERWIWSDTSGMVSCSYEGTAIAPGAPVTALVRFKPGNSVDKASKFNLLGAIRIRGGSKGRDSSFFFQELILGI